MTRKRAGKEGRRKKSSLITKIVGWGVGLGLVVLLAYGASQMSGVPYGESALGAVNFSGLDANQKRAALKAANQARCTCGCGLGLAECVATDSTCPIRESNIERIRAMVRDAGQGRL
ncbi:MAG: hypothetical protein EXQ48_06170 [Acidobacteria bacterium]|nr:hypothetical protein [Acidobacteriota bacterium]